MPGMAVVCLSGGGAQPVELAEALNQPLLGLRHLGGGSEGGGGDGGGSTGGCGDSGGGRGWGGDGGGAVWGGGGAGGGSLGGGGAGDGGEGSGTIRRTVLKLPWSRPMTMVRRETVTERAVRRATLDAPRTGSILPVSLC